MPGAVAATGDVARRIARIEHVSQAAQTALRRAGWNVADRLGIVPERLVPMSRDQARAFATELRGLFSWRDDGYCTRRALLGAQLINQGTRIGASPADDAASAVVALVHRPRISRWKYHAATKIQIDGERERTVIDGLAPRLMMAESEWRRWLGGTTGRMPRVSDRSTFAVIDLGLLPNRMRRTGRELIAAIRSAATTPPRNA